MSEVGIGDIWRFHFWNDPDDHDDGIKSYTYLIIDKSSEWNPGYVATELETDTESFLLGSSFLKDTRKINGIEDDYIVFVEKLA